VAHLETGTTWRGGQAQVLHLVRGLTARGHDVLVLAPPAALLDAARGSGIAAVPWRARGDWDLGAAFAAMRALARFRPDVMHAHTARAHAVGVPAARLAGVPVVVVSRRAAFDIGTHAASRLKYRMPVDRYLCVSRGVWDAMRRGGVPEARLALVPSGVPLPSDHDGGAGPDLRAWLGLPRGAPVVGTVAALTPEKGHADLLVAAARVVAARPEVQFVWLGDGACRATLERARARAGLERNIHLPGFRDDAAALVGQFTVFALASRAEGLGSALLDAQARGVPVVATATGGIPDIVEDGVTGRLVAPSDPEALALGLLEALEHPDRAARMASAARERVRSFSVDLMVERTLAVYERALAAILPPAGEPRSESRR